MAGPDLALQQSEATAVFDRLAERELVIVSGKGGVGRTTLSAVIGLALAERGRRTLIATTGHDDRLAWMLGRSELPDTATRVGSRLYVQRLVPHVCLREYGTLVVRSARVASAVFDNRVVRRLAHAIPGLDDFAVLGKAWHEAARGGDFDTVVFDGPATGHLLYTVGLPHAILAAIPPGPLTREAELMRAALTDPSRTEAVLVGLPEAWPLTELAELGASLRSRLQIGASTIIVNGLWPSGLSGLSPSASATAGVTALADYLESIAAVGERHRQEVETWARSDAAAKLEASTIMPVPWVWDGLAEPHAVRELLASLEGVAAVRHAATHES